MRLPLLALLLATPAFAADPDAKSLDQAIRQLKEKLTRSKQSSQIRGMTLPSPHYLQHYPTYFPPEQPAKPTTEPQKESTPEPAVQPSKPKAAAKDEANPLLGTWVREVPGFRVTLKFSEKRLFATLEMASKPEGKGLVETGTIKLDADYGVGHGGRVFGVVTGTDFTLSNWTLLGAVVNAEAVEAALDELPFSFRARADDDTLTVAGLKAQFAGETNGLIVRLLGKFHRGNGAPLPPIKPVKTESPFLGLGSSTPGDRIGFLGVAEMLGAATGNPKAGSLHREEAPLPRDVPTTQPRIRYSNAITFTGTRDGDAVPWPEPKPANLNSDFWQYIAERSTPSGDLPPIPVIREEAPKPRPVSAPAPMYYPLPSQRS